MRTSPAGNSRGFTFIELAVVMAIMGLIAAMLTFRLSGLTEKKHKLFLKRLEHLLRLARVRAISRGKTVYVAVDPKLRLVTIEGTEVFLDIPEDVAVESKGIRWEMAKDTLRFPFYPDGSSGGGTIFVRWGDNEWKININPVTGLLKVAALHY